MAFWLVSLLLLTACSTAPPTCGQAAWEAAGQAMSNVQYHLSRQADWVAMVNCSSANGCPSVPLILGSRLANIAKRVIGGLMRGSLTIRR
jgi:hypothetical protein